MENNTVRKPTRDEMIAYRETLIRARENAKTEEEYSLIIDAISNVDVYLFLGLER